MVIRYNAYYVTDPECQKECGNLLFDLGCYIQKRIHMCGGSTGWGDIFGSGSEDTGQLQIDICGKDCDAPGESPELCRAAKVQANCGGFSIFNEIGSATSNVLGIPKEYLIIIGGGLIVILIAVLVSKRRR